MPDFLPWKEKGCHTRMGKKMYGSIPAFRLNGENQAHHYPCHIEKFDGRKAVQDRDISK
jgi:hypothetical protein